MFHLGKQFIILIICGCIFLLLLIIGIVYFLNRPKHKSCTPPCKLPNTCSPDGICTCVSTCGTKNCGTDNCGVANKCGSCTLSNYQCSPDGKCELNTFVAVGEGSDTIAWSDDGKIWNKISSGSGFNKRGTCVASNGNVWVAGGEESGDNRKNMVFSTDNGRTWSPVTPPSGTASLNLKVNGLAWNGTNFIAVGFGFNGGKTAVWSEDGQIWNSSTSIFRLFLNSLACNETICVALSIGPKAVIIYSDDSGNSWNEGTGEKFSDNSVGSFVAVNDNNKWIAICKNSTGTSTNILISSGGIDWVSPTNNIFTGSDVELYCVAHDNGSNWVVVGNKGIGYSSDNGSKWEVATKNNIRIKDYYHSVVYNGKIWVASGLSYILYSSDGLSWTKSDTTNSFENHLCWNGTVWVLGALESPAIRWSEDVTKPWNNTQDTVFKSIPPILGVVHDIACRYKV